MTFGPLFNQPIDLPKSLTHLIFGDRFNQPIDLPESITHLTFGDWFNKFIEIPSSITNLKIWKGQKNLKIKYNNEIIKIQNLPININYHDPIIMIPN